MVDPVILFFVLGVGAKLARSDLRLPEPLYETLAIYLMLAIGLKGGIEIARQPLASVIPHAFTAIALGAAIPLLVYPLLRRAIRLSVADAASIAAHYGSVSVVTFAVAASVLLQAGVPTEPHMPLLVALMEAPGIVVGIVLARVFGRTAADAAAAPLHWGRLTHEVVFGKTVLLLAGGLTIGAIAGPEALAPIEPVFFGLFKGVLALFLLEMGLVAGGRIGDLKRAGAGLVVFGIAAPVALGLLGAAVGHLAGMSVGGTALLATLAASASYIAAPAAMRIAVPVANPALSIGVALGVTFPFNITLGIPLYMQYARWLGE
jgi:uncharacterized protein